MTFGIKFNAKAAKAMARCAVLDSEQLMGEQLPVLSNNSIEKFAVEMEETLKCEMYQREKAEQKALCKENEMSRKSV